jgi:hypothetical protein
VILEGTSQVKGEVPASVTSRCGSMREVPGERPDPG